MPPKMASQFAQRIDWCLFISQLLYAHAKTRKAMPTINPPPVSMKTGPAMQASGNHPSRHRSAADSQACDQSRRRSQAVYTGSSNLVRKIRVPRAQSKLGRRGAEGFEQGNGFASIHPCRSSYMKDCVFPKTSGNCFFKLTLYSHTKGSVGRMCQR